MSATRTATATASVLVAPGQVELVSLRAPAAGPHDVVVRIEGCGVCASSLPLWEGRPWFSYPQPAGAPGHEAWGRVHELGEGVERLRVGQRVAMLSFAGFAQLERVPAEACIALPDELDGLPFPGEALGCAFNVVRRARIVPGHAVAVVGMGFLGTAIAQLCRHLGSEVVPVPRDRIVEGPFARVIEAGGTQQSLDVASSLVDEGGVLVIAGYHQDGPRQVDVQSWNWRGLDVVNAHERLLSRQLEGMAEAARLAVDGAFDLERLCTHAFAADELAQAFEAARLRPPGFTKAVVAQ